MKKKGKIISSVIMLVVLIAGIVGVIYGNRGTAIYENAATMMGTDKKMAMTYIQNPDKLTELGKVSKAGADNIKEFLKGLGSWFLTYDDWKAYDTALKDVEARETAEADSQDHEKLVDWAVRHGKGIGKTTYEGLKSDPAQLEKLENEMALSLLDVTRKQIDADRALVNSAAEQLSYEAVIQEIEAYEAAYAQAEDDQVLLAWAQETLSYTPEIFEQVAADKKAIPFLRQEMALDQIGITLKQYEYDMAVKELADYEEALNKARDPEQLVAWAEKTAAAAPKKKAKYTEKEEEAIARYDLLVSVGLAHEKLSDVEKDAGRLAELRKEMILSLSGVTDEKLAQDREIIAHAFDEDKKAPFEAAVDSAVDARARYEDAAANAKDKDKFLAWAQKKGKGIAEESFIDLIKEPDRQYELRVEMALAQIGITGEELDNAQKLVASGDQGNKEAYDAAVATVDAFSSAWTEVRNVSNFLEWSETEGKNISWESYKALLKQKERIEGLRAEMIMEELDITQEEYDKVSSNSELLGLFKGNIYKLLENQHMTSAVIFQFIGIILIVAALAFFLIQAMDIKPRQRVRAANPKARKVTSFLLNYALFIIMGLILVVVSIINIKFLDVKNIMNILQNASTKGILALGCAGLIVLAGTDLSIGRVLGISAAVTASLVQSTTYASRMYPTMTNSLGTFGLLLPLFASIAIAIAFCMINGFGVAKLHLHAFIVTLGTQLVAYGANCLYIESQPSGTAQALSTFDQNFLNIAAGAINIAGVRIPIVVIYFIALAAIVWVIWNKTKLGKNMFAVGGNTEAAAVSGVNVAKTIMLVYLMAGVLYGIASFLEAARITSVGANTGLNYETDAISAVVVGGVSFSGGVGTIQGVVIGAVILQAIVYALQFLGVNPYIQYIIRGLIIILAVSIDVRKYIVKK